MTKSIGGIGISKRSVELNRRAIAVFPGRQSNFRRAPVGPAVFVERAAGCRYWDVDGRTYIDLVLGMGPAIWGHSHPEYVGALHAQLDRLYSAPSSTVHTEMELLLAEKMVELVPCAEWVRFGISGTEADQLVLRLARAFTGRPHFVRFAGHYHGWLDNVFGGHLNPDSEAPPHAVDDAIHPGRTEGRAPCADRESFMVPWNDAAALERVLERWGESIGLVLMEPIMCNTGCCPPRSGYLEQVRQLCDRYGALLCFDEVITGFRVALGGAQEVFGVTPDLAVFGKALAGGLPLAAVAGRRDILQLLRDGRVLGGGTFNSFPLAIAAGVVSLSLLERDGQAYYRRVDTVQQALVDGLRCSAHRHGQPLLLQGPRGIFYYDFLDRESAWTPDELKGADLERSSRFRALALEEGVLLGGGNRIVVTGVMTDAELEQALAGLDRAMARLH